MSTRISKISQSAPVVEYATSAAQDATATLEIANFIAPTVNVTLPNFRYMVYNTQNRFRIPNAERANGGEATQIKTGGTETSGVLKPYALDYPIDEFETAGGGDALSDAQIQGIFNDAADVTAQLGALSWATTVTAAALTAAGAGTDLDSTNASLDLVNSLDAGIEAVAKASMCGQLCPVKVIIGTTAMRRLKNHVLVRGRFNNGTKGGKGDLATGGVNPTDVDVMGLLLGNPKTKVSWITYDAADEGATAAPTFALGNQVLIFASADAPSRVDPSFMKTFRLRDMWMKPGRYTRADGRGEVFKMDWYALPVVTNSTAIARYNIT